MRKAVIDVGSNSVLLLVQERLAEGWNSVYEASEVTSLGADVKASKILSEVGMARTLRALKTFYEAAKAQGAQNVTAAATMAARIALNTNQFLDMAAKQGTPVFVLSGEQEAQLGFDAVAYDPQFAKCPRITMVDVGGQSTEVVTGESNNGWTVQFARSFPIGTLALKSSTLQAECPTPPDILNAVVEIDESIAVSYRRGQCGDPVAVGATGTNLITIKNQISEWDPKKVHGQWLSFGEISELCGLLMQMTERQRRELVGMEPGREATLPAGALILERVLDAIGAPGTYVSTHGWRHALLQNGLPNLKGQENCLPT